jgi:hypothetical protein
VLGREKKEKARFFLDLACAVRRVMIGEEMLGPLCKEPVDSGDVKRRKTFLGGKGSNLALRQDGRDRRWEKALKVCYLQRAHARDSRHAGAQDIVHLAGVAFDRAHALLARQSDVE